MRRNLMWTLGLILLISLVVTSSAQSFCGDVNGDEGGPNYGDLTFLVAYLYSNGSAPPNPPGCRCRWAGNGHSVRYALLSGVLD